MQTGVMAIEAGTFIGYRPPRRSLLSVTTGLSYLSHSFCRSVRPIGRRKLIEYSGRASWSRGTTEPDGALRARTPTARRGSGGSNQGVVADEYADAHGWNRLPLSGRGCERARQAQVHTAAVSGCAATRRRPPAGAGARRLASF